MDEEKKGEDLESPDSKFILAKELEGVLEEEGNDGMEEDEREG